MYFKLGAKKMSKVSDVQFVHSNQKYQYFLCLKIRYLITQKITNMHKNINGRLFFTNVANELTQDAEIQ